MDKELLEYYHNEGQIPDKYYYQLNGKSQDENYRDIKRKRFSLKKKKFTLEDFILSMIQPMAEVAIMSAVNRILPPDKKHR